MKADGRTDGQADSRTRPVQLRPSSEQLSLLSARPPATDRESFRVRLPVLDVRQRGTSFHEVPVKAILNSPASTGMGFWSLNPYVGCEFGCTYCYARDTHRWMVERLEGQGGPKELPDGRRGAVTASLPLRPPAPLDFERRILVKTSAAAVLQRTLFPAKLAGATLVIGTATDPYQPAERRFRLTRSLLEALLGWRGLTLGITTKSPLILRDLALLQQLAARHTLSVNISLASVDAALLRRIEARSPAPHARLRALKGLTDGGIHAGLLIAPVLPGITDSRESLAAVLTAGKAAGARYAVGLALRLGSAARHRFLPHLAQEFPELVERYERHYARRQSAQRTYTEALGRRLRALQREFGFPVRGEKKEQGAGSRERAASQGSPVSQGSLLYDQLQ